MNELAGGFYRGDRVLCNGMPGMVFGKPARAACVRISVSVMYDDGTVKDERVANLQLLEDLEDAGEPLPGPAPAASPPPIPARALAEEAAEAEGDGDEDLDTTQLQPGPRLPVPKIQGIGRRAGIEEPEARRLPEPPAENLRAPPQVSLPRRNLFDEPETAPEAAPVDQEKVESMADAVLEKIRRNYSNLQMAFRALDRSNNGYISRVDFLDALEHIFINSGCTPEEVEEIAARFGFGEGCSETLSFEEFCQVAGEAESDPYVETMQGVEVPREDRSDRQRIEEVQLAIQAFRQICERRYASMRESFRALDKGRRSALNPTEFAAGLSMHGVNLKPEEMQDAWEIFDPNGTGQISYADFCRVMSQRMQFGKHLSRQMYK